MKVYLDLDGVIVNFRKGVCDALGFSYADHSVRKWMFWEDWPNITFEMVNAICTQEFWRTLNFTQDGQILLYGWVGLMEKFEDITLLTTPMPNPGSWSGKYLWIRDNMPAKFMENVIMLQGSKAQLAGPDTLLIDDKDENVEEFRAVGGQAILVPRMWNKDAHLASQSAKIVKKCLETF